MLFLLAFQGTYPAPAHAASLAEEEPDGSRLLGLRKGTYEAEYSTIAKDGTLTEETRELEADFGTIEVPENRRDSETRMIRLPIVRIRATGNDPAEPIFWFAGGRASRTWRLFNTTTSSRSTTT